MSEDPAELHFAYLGNPAGFEVWGARYRDWSYVITYNWSHGWAATVGDGYGRKDRLGTHFPDFDAARRACEEDAEKRMN